MPNIPPAPRITNVRMGRDGPRLTVRVHHDGAVSLEIAGANFGVDIALDRDAASDLVFALTEREAA